MTTDIEAERALYYLAEAECLHHNDNCANQGPGTVPVPNLQFRHIGCVIAAILRDPSRGMPALRVSPLELYLDQATIAELRALGMEAGAANQDSIGVDPRTLLKLVCDWKNLQVGYTEPETDVRFLPHPDVRVLQRALGMKVAQIGCGHGEWPCVTCIDIAEAYVSATLMFDAECTEILGRLQAAREPAWDPFARFLVDDEAEDEQGA